MFEAFVIVCAANFSYEINYDSCFPMTDEWGPYETQENCDIRTNQMVDEILRGPIAPLLFELYSNMGIPTEQIYAEGVCRELNVDDV